MDEIGEVEVFRMGEELRELRSVVLWDLVLDPESFGRTVEKLYWLSFLVFDGVAALDMSADPANCIVHRQGKTCVEGSTQFTVKLDYPKWEELAKEYGGRGGPLAVRRKEAAVELFRMKLSASQRRTW